ncbi:hypothetical protein GQ53DRAFT_690670 [Thozetella sp. PMI_491]|nr:hypothetical protein GQ53DRAFT_690670 [Thozetella sp. PMI_491]
MASRQPSDRAPKVRRMHNKSRRGCQECKRRHIKCDEGRPHCVNCSVSQRCCEYGDPAPANSDVAPLFPGQAARPLSADRAASLLIEVSETSHGGKTQDLEDGQTFTLKHMQLFHHVERGITTWLGATDFMAPLVHQYIETALTVPYLMNQLLALAAQHLSHTATEEAASYRALATELQTRGLSLFIAANDNADATPRWYFSSLLAVHNLAATMALCRRCEFDTFLDTFISHMGYHQGTQAIGNASWMSIQNGGLRDWLQRVEASSPTATAAIDNPADPFPQVLQSSHLNASSIATCLEASAALNFIREKLQGPDSWGPHAVLAWPNLVSHDFISLLGARVPEALLILIYYAELAHDFRDFWVFGDAGEFLITNLAMRLGKNWAKWLERPMAAVSRNNPRNHEAP